MIRSALNYLRCFSGCLADPERRRLLAAHRSRPKVLPADRTDALREAIGYLLRAQDHSGDGGFGSYHLVDGWGRSYPETTGYIIPTLFSAGEHLHWDEPRQRALRAADWLLSIQRADGGWDGHQITMLGLDTHGANDGAATKDFDAVIVPSRGASSRTHWEGGRRMDPRGRCAIVRRASGCVPRTGTHHASITASGRRPRGSLRSRRSPPWTSASPPPGSSVPAAGSGACWWPGR